MVRYWLICLEEQTLGSCDIKYKQLHKLDYKAIAPTSELGLSMISKEAAKHSVLKIVVFKELDLKITIQSGILE